MQLGRAAFFAASAVALATGVCLFLGTLWPSEAQHALRHAGGAPTTPQPPSTSTHDPPLTPSIPPEPATAATHVPASSAPDEHPVPFVLVPAAAAEGCPAPGVARFVESGEKLCPIPGFNNLLFTQVNRFYCAVRDGLPALTLRDRVCMKYSTDWFRYSEVLTFAPPPGARGRAGTRVCFRDDAPNPEFKRPCEWRHVQEWYGTPPFWAARRAVDFNAGYHAYADAWLRRHLPHAGGTGPSEAAVWDHHPYLAVHVRRGDYQTHCLKMKKKKEQTWLSYSWNSSHTKFALSPEVYGAGCYPSVDDVAAGVARVLGERRGVKSVFVSSNDKQLVKELQRRNPRVPFFQLAFHPRGNETEAPGGSNSGGGLRGVDLAIVDMIIMARASAWILNRFSSFSATPYEMAYTAGRIQHKSLWWW
ncbi:hypothetical protein DIPPA_33472 [Diplonema papillatum]|nr:hypothetical protein DIPPA_33472 [Diplonema papillatum]KAJ9457017.1 hypothetical protein DIPPA_33472 [Diplonema papillatum]KAJ9457018.1 hypothetical protein DIPPA_33472 [Diplonema papillatum]